MWICCRRVGWKRRRKWGAAAGKRLREVAVCFCLWPATVGKKNQNQGGGEKFKPDEGKGAAGLVEIGLGLGCFFCIFLIFQNYPLLLNVLRRLVFIGEMLLGFSTWSLNFFLFVNFDFSYFFVFF